MRRFALPMALLIAFALVAPVAAESKSATYHGDITGAVFSCGTVPVDPPYEVTGTWTLNLSNDRTATVTGLPQLLGSESALSGLGEHE